MRLHCHHRWSLDGWCWYCCFPVLADLPGQAMLLAVLYCLRLQASFRALLLLRLGRLPAAGCLASNTLPALPLTLPPMRLGWQPAPPPPDPLGQRLPLPQAAPSVGSG